MMKNWITTSLIVLMTVGFTVAGVAQKAPQQVKEALSEKYPDAAFVEWDYNNDNDEIQGYEAEFILNGQEYNAFFKEEGSWIQTEIEISRKNVPEAIVSTLKSDYDKLRVDGVYKVQSPEDIQYKVELDMENENENNEIDYLLFKQDGTLIKKVMDEEGWFF